MQHKQINLHSKRIKIILITTLLCVVGFSGCETDKYIFKSPIEEYNESIHKNIIGKWKLVGKSFAEYHQGLDLYPPDVDLTEENKYIEFIKIGDNRYGKYKSNMYPEEGYYVPTTFGICYYHSFNSLQDKSLKVGGYDYACFDDSYLHINNFKKLRLIKFSDAEWFEDHSVYNTYYFTKTEDK